LPDDGVIAFWQPQDELMCSGERRCRNDLLHRHGRVRERNVVAYRAVEQHIFLQHDAQLPTQPGGVDGGKVDALHHHAPTLRYVEPLGKLGERALAGARGADDANDLTGRTLKLTSCSTSGPSIR